MNGFSYGENFVELKGRGRRKIEWPGCHKHSEMTEELCREVMNEMADCYTCNIRRRELSRKYNTRAKEKKTL